MYIYKSRFSMFNRQKFQIIPSVFIILIDTSIPNSKRILLSKRLNTGFMDGYWSLPAGHIEECESIYEAAAREIKEELGIEIDQKNLQIVHIRHHLDEGRINFYLKCTSNSNFQVINNEPEKCSQLKWFSFDELPENLLATITESLDSINQHNIYSSTSMSEPRINDFLESSKISQVRIRERESN